MSKILEQRDLGNGHGRSWATVLFPHSLTFVWPQRVSYVENERCPGRKSKRINVWRRIYRCVCYYEHRELLLWAAPSLRAWASPQLSERQAAASVSQMRMWGHTPKSWDLNTGCQAAKPILINLLLSAWFCINKEKKEGPRLSYLLLSKQFGPFLNGSISAHKEINIWR